MDPSHCMGCVRIQHGAAEVTSRFLTAAGLSAIAGAICHSTGVGSLDTILITFGIGLITGAAKPKDKP